MATLTTTQLLSENDQRLVQTLAIGLAENLLHHYPNTNTNTNTNETDTPDYAAQVQCWLNEILERIQQQHGDGNGNGTDTDNDNDLIMAQLVMKEGIHRWQSNQSIFASAGATKKAGSNSKSMTFSFLDQWNAAGTGGGLSLLDSIITWDRIQQQTDQDSQLKLLLKVQHMDDIHPDWDKVCPLLLQGLQQQISSTTTTATTSDNSDANDVVVVDDPSSAGDFIKLHETLFDQSRSSPEYTTAQIQLCQNIVTVLRESLALVSTASASTNTSIRSPTAQRLLRRLVRAFWDMWMDWMVCRGGGPNSNVNLVESIGRDVWSCYSNDNSDSDKIEGTFPSVLMQVVMKEQDPYAQWFTSWVAHLPPPKVVSLVESSPQLVGSMVLACESTATGYNGGDSNDNDHDNHDELCRHSLVLLASILRQTRVSLFPWHIIILNDNGALALASVSRLFALFHDAMERELRLRTTIHTSASSTAKRERAPDLPRIQVCADAMETLLWGCAKSDPTTFRALLTKLDNMILSLATNAMNDSTDVGAQVHELLNGVQRRLRDRNK
jgi:hypothetical protein